jgi:feruloyl esterase
MTRRLAALVAALAAAAAQAQAPDAQAPAAAARCEALLDMPDLTVTQARFKPATAAAPAHCYVRGSIAGRIRFHMQLPAPAAWNGRLVNVGDGGKDGDLDYADHRVAQGYAVANSNTGHDAAAEPAASFAADDPQALIDFAYRAVHLTANASKAVVRAYYGEPQRYAYFEGCSTGGRQGLMEAQRYPADFDGIVAGAPVHDYQVTNLTNLWMVQRMFADGFAGNLAYDADGDGVGEDLTKWRLLRDAVLEVCDAADGVADGLVADPPSCEFVPSRHLARHACAAGADAADCFTGAQFRAIEDLYRGPYDSRGVQVGGGMDFGSEYAWDRSIIPHAGNGRMPSRLRYVTDHMNYLFYERSPGVPVPDPTNVGLAPDKSARPPEFAWWEFRVDDYTSGKARHMEGITDATNPDLSRFLLRESGKLLLYHGWADPERPARPVIEYHDAVVERTFGGDRSRASERVRLFMVPGMGHCEGGPGPSEWDRLAPLVEWVENGTAPEHIVAERREQGRVTYQRRLCPHPAKAVYVGPARGANDPVNWIESNFACR